MSTVSITSASNENFKRWKKISESSRAIKKFGTTLAEGIHLSLVLQEKNILPVAVIVSAGHVDKEALPLISYFEERGVRVYELSETLYNEISPVEHGVGLMTEVPIQKIPLPTEPLAVDVLYLDGVQDMGNVGTLIRTAVAAGVKTIVTSPKTAAVWAEKVLRASMGAHFGASIYEGMRPEQLPQYFQSKILAADARGGHDLFSAPYWAETPTVWMMGAEGPGLSDEALAMASERYLINIEKDCESLNVAAAAAVCLFEQRRRRLKKI